MNLPPSAVWQAPQSPRRARYSPRLTSASSVARRGASPRATMASTTERQARRIRRTTSVHTIATRRCIRSPALLGASISLQADWRCAAQRQKNRPMRRRPSAGEPGEVGNAGQLRQPDFSESPDIQDMRLDPGKAEGIEDRAGNHADDGRRAHAGCRRRPPRGPSRAIAVNDASATPNKAAPSATASRLASLM